MNATNISQLILQTKKKITKLYQLLKIDADCIVNRDLELNVKNFPDLYPTGENGMNEIRITKLNVYE